MEGVLTQISVRTGEVRRHPSFFDPPVVEVNLEPGHSIISFEIERSNPYASHRKTCDWRWRLVTAWQDHDGQ